MDSAGLGQMSPSPRRVVIALSPIEKRDNDMSTKHNTKHNERGRSNYSNRLGVMGTTGHLPAIEGNTGLRHKQERRVMATCTVGDNHNGHECNGSPFPNGSDTSEDDE